MDINIVTLINFLNDDTLKIYKDEENRIIIDGNINITTKNYCYFPVKIYKLNGNITWNNTLISLYNFPDIVNGNINIINNKKLTTLKYCPHTITGNLNVYNCNISDLTGIAKEIGGLLNLSNNPVSDVTELYNVNFKHKYIKLVNTEYARQHYYDILYHNDTKYSIINNATVIIEDDW